MSIFSTHPALRWAVPGVAVAAVVGGASASGVIAAQADTPLAPRTAAQLLVDIQNARLDGLSGTVVQRADLGVPALPGIGGQGSGSGSSSGSSGSGSSDLSSLVSGTHTLRLWYAGPDQTRVALLGTSGESDVIHNGKDVWLWSSQDKSATHVTLPAAHGAAMTPREGATALPTSPQQAADLALKAISPTTAVTTSGAARVAGRSAYELVLTPKEPTSLVASVRLAIDSQRHVPLRVQIFAKGSTEPAFEVAFSSVDFGRPDAAQFAFNPPAGTKVTERTLPAHPGTQKMGMAHPNPDAAPSAAAGEPKVVGKGWGSVVVATMPAKSQSGSGDQQSLKAMLGLLPRVSGSWGSGHLLEGKLFSAVLTDDGRVAVGAVTPQTLYAALAAR
jgi:outer membrane lipoprotein-sorting protein